MASIQHKIYRTLSAVTLAIHQNDFAMLSFLKTNTAIIYSETKKFNLVTPFKFMQL